MGPDENDTGPLTVYMDGRPVGIAGGEIPEISLTAEEPVEAVPSAAFSGGSATITLEQASEAMKSLAGVGRDMYNPGAGRKGAGQGVGSLPGGAGVPGGHAVGLCLRPSPGLSLPAHQEKADQEEVRQADPGLVSGGGPVNATAYGEQNQTLHTCGGLCGQPAAHEKNHVYKVPAHT